MSKRFSKTMSRKSVINITAVLGLFLCATEARKRDLDGVNLRCCTAMENPIIVRNEAKVGTMFMPIELREFTERQQRLHS